MRPLVVVTAKGPENSSRMTTMPVWLYHEHERGIADRRHKYETFPV